jgi:membrane associated rhomboid family serine protease
MGLQIYSSSLSMIWFPIGDDSIVHKWTPWVAYWFLLLNVLVFLFQQTLSWYELQWFIMEYASIPNLITQWQNLEGLFTSMFLHGGWMHLIGNMLFLRVFADNIEHHLWHVKFLLFYLAWWLAASALHIVFNRWSVIPAIGASGAIAAVLWAYISYFPHSQIKVFDIIYRRIFYMPAVHFLWFWIALQLISGVGWLASSGGGVARWAHIGGFAFWLAFAIATGWSKPTRWRRY